MASMVGKWLREALMARIVRFYRGHVPDLPDASGYHDPVTKGFVHATRLVRRREKVPNDCFERRRVEPASRRSRRAGPRHLRVWSTSVGRRLVVRRARDQQQRQ